MVPAMNTLCCPQLSAECEFRWSVQPKVDEIERVNRAAYELLADEYDAAEHETTRVLEDLSDGLLLAHLPDTDSAGLRVLEIGCGTGRLMEKIVTSRRRLQSYCAVDISPRMCELARQRAGEKNLTENIHFRCTSVFHEDLGKNGQYNLVIAGLADPYFVRAALQNIRRVCASDTSFIFSLPESSWASRERSERLGVATNVTRFRLRTGSPVLSYSFTYPLHELAELLSSAQMDVRVAKTAVSSSGLFNATNPPAIILGVAT